MFIARQPEGSADLGAPAPGRERAGSRSHRSPRPASGRATAAGSLPARKASGGPLVTRRHEVAAPGSEQAQGRPASPCSNSGLSSTTDCRTRSSCWRREISVPMRTGPVPPAPSPRARPALAADRLSCSCSRSTMRLNVRESRPISFAEGDADPGLEASFGDLLGGVSPASSGAGQSGRARGRWPTPTRTAPGRGIPAYSTKMIRSSCWLPSSRRGDPGPMELSASSSGVAGHLVGGAAQPLAVGLAEASAAGGEASATARPSSLSWALGRATTVEALRLVVAGAGRGVSRRSPPAAA